MFSVSFTHSCNVFVGICLLHFLDIIIYMGRVYMSFDARMRDLRHSVSSCTILNYVTINIIYRRIFTYCHRFFFSSSNYTVALFIYRSRLYSYIVIHGCLPLPPSLLHPLTLVLPP